MEHSTHFPHTTSLGGQAPSRLLLLAASVALVGLLGACANNSVLEEEPSATPAPTADQPDPVDCYTPPDAAPGPSNTNRYAIALVTDSGAHAGALDEYMHCAVLPVVDPTAAADCYSAASDNPEHLRGVNRFAIAELSGTADAGDLDRYEHCKYLPVMQPAAN